MMVQILDMILLGKLAIDKIRVWTEMKQQTESLEGTSWEVMEVIERADDCLMRMSTYTVIRQMFPTDVTQVLQCLLIPLRHQL